jgi:transposase-like protein
MSQPNTETEWSAPTKCPFCQSLEISTTSKISDADSYWRCKHCGEVWNEGRVRNRPYPYRR